MIIGSILYYAVKRDTHTAFLIRLRETLGHDTNKRCGRGFGHHGMPPPGCNNITAILLMPWATLLPILIILRLFVLELWAGRVRHTM